MSKKFQHVFIIDLIWLILSAFYRCIDEYLVPDHIFLDAFGFTVNTVIYIGIVGYFGISIYQRVMQKITRNYLLAFCILSIIWFMLRNIKWRAFECLGFESRFTWYLFYIPMILIPLCSFFVALSMGKDENYKPSRKWNILYILAVILIIIVLTNDLHQLVFMFQPNFRNWDYNYNYGIMYYLVQFFIWPVILSSAFILFKKWRKINRTKNAYLPIFVIAMGVLYVATYILNRVLASVFADITTFSVLFYILFWESCIQVGMIRSNTKHKEFFEHSKVAVQILDKNGEPNLISSQAVQISKEDFISLKEKKKIISDDMILHIAPITSGYVAWTKDISKLNEMNQELEELRDELYGEVAFLEEERKLKEQHARLQKLNNLYDLISKEVFPQVDKIEALIKKDHIDDEISQDTVLKKITLTSCYVKRKTNLLLQMDSGKSITNVDMVNCYNESFRGLGLFGTGCNIKYNPPACTDVGTHLLCYDLFEELLEMTDFALEMIFVNCMEDEKNLRFSVEIPLNNYISESSLANFKQSELEKLGCTLKIYEDDESVTILLLFPKNKEVS